MLRYENHIRGHHVASFEPHHVSDAHIDERHVALFSAADDAASIASQRHGVQRFKLGVFRHIVRGGHRGDDGDGAEYRCAFDPPCARERE